MDVLLPAHRLRLGFKGSRNRGRERGKGVGLPSLIHDLKLHTSKSCTQNDVVDAALPLPNLPQFPSERHDRGVPVHVEVHDANAALAAPARLPLDFREGGLGARRVPARDYDLGGPEVDEVDGGCETQATGSARHDGDLVGEGVRWREGDGEPFHVGLVEEFTHGAGCSVVYLDRYVGREKKG